MTKAEIEEALENGLVVSHKDFNATTFLYQSIDNFFENEKIPIFTSIPINVTLFFQNKKTNVHFPKRIYYCKLEDETYTIKPFLGDITDDENWYILDLNTL